MTMTGKRKVSIGVAVAIILLFVVVRPGSRDATDTDISSVQVPVEAADAAPDLAAAAQGETDDGISVTNPASSMATSLIETTDENRKHILRLSIVGDGFDCAEVISAGAVGTSGRVWRVRCTEALIYSLEVDEFERVQVTPTPYGDIPSPTGPLDRTPGVPEVERQQFELRRQEFERRQEQEN